MTAAAHDTAIPDFVRTITTRTPCAKNPNMWQSKDPDTIELARRDCALCPVEGACLRWAMDHPQELGTWGGLTRRQRLGRRSKWIADPTTALAPKTPAGPARQCRCGRFIPADHAGPYCAQHPNGVPLLGDKLLAVLEASLDGASLPVIAARVGVSTTTVVNRFALIYRRLGVADVAPARRRSAAMAAARAAGVLPVAGQGVAA